MFFRLLNRNLRLKDVNFILDLVKLLILLLRLYQRYWKGSMSEINNLNISAQNILII